MAKERKVADHLNQMLNEVLLRSSKSGFKQVSFRRKVLSNSFTKESKQVDMEGYISSHLLQTIFQSMADFLWVIQPDYTVTEVNKATMDFFGCERVEIIGTPIQNYISSDQQAFLTKILSEVSLHAHVQDFELVFRSKNGDLLPTSCTASLLTEGSQAKGVLLIAKDISPIKRVEDALVSKNKELDTFLYRSSHDLKGPLASILGVVELARREIRDNDALDYFEMVKTSATRLDKILMDLTELARLRNTTTKVHKVDVPELVDQLIAKQLVDRRLQDVQVIRHFDQKRILYSNAIIISSVLNSLLDNSIKFRRVHRDSPPYIKITVADHKRGVRVILEDNGAGIPAHLVPKVFDMFERANIHSKGAGLGLYLAKTSVEKLQGTIDLQSIDRVGTSVEVFFPSLTADTI